MTQVRSRSYPNVSLPEAIDLITKIYDKERTHSMDRAVAAGHLGYNSLNGASAVLLGTLAHYGFLERMGKGETRVSKLAVDILVPESDEGRDRAIKDAASRPKLFQQLDARFPEGAPSEENLRNFLLRLNFTDRAIRPAVNAYIKTREFIEHKFDNTATENIEHGEDIDSGDVKKAVNLDVREHGTQRDVNIQRKENAPPQSEYSRDIFAVEEGEISIVIPRNISQDSYDDIEAWINLILRRIKRSIQNSADMREKTEDRP